MAKLSEILSEMKDEVKVQFLPASTVNVVDKKRTKDTEITFATTEVSCNDINGDKIGMVVWFSRAEYNRAISKLNNN